LVKFHALLVILKVLVRRELLELFSELGAVHRRPHILEVKRHALVVILQELFLSMTFPSLKDL
jgi:hypothetical protein